MSAVAVPLGCARIKDKVGLRKKKKKKDKINAATVVENMIVKNKNAH